MNFQIVMAIVAVVLFLIVLFGFFVPIWNKPTPEVLPWTFPTAK